MSPRERQARRRSKTHAVPVILGSVFGFLLICGIAFGVGMMVNVNRWLSDLPDYTDIDNYMTSEPTSIVDMNGNEIASLYVQNRDSVEFDQISPYVIKGTVDVEDERFYAHPGVDIIGIGRAVLNQLAGRSEGASTITQQLVRNTILSEEQFDNTIERKVREAWIALQMEKIFSKDEILTMYLNTIYYGHGAYGIQAASVTYFSKNASDLTLAEAALLIGLPNAPGYYDPTTNPDLALSRRNKVLGNMLRQGTITQEEHDASVAEPITLNLTEQTVNGTYAHPYFVDYVKTLLQEEFSTDVLFKGSSTPSRPPSTPTCRPSPRTRPSPHGRGGRRGRRAQRGHDGHRPQDRLHQGDGRRPQRLPECRTTTTSTTRRAAPLHRLGLQGHHARRRHRRRDEPHAAHQLLFPDDRDRDRTTPPTASCATTATTTTERSPSPRRPRSPPTRATCRSRSPSATTRSSTCPRSWASTPTPRTSTPTPPRSPSPAASYRLLHGRDGRGLRHLRRGRQAPQRGGHHRDPQPRGRDPLPAQGRSHRGCLPQARPPR